MDGRETDDDDTLERHTDTNKLTGHTARLAATHPEHKHETFGGGFSPTAVLKLRRLARKVARGSVDRTAYSPKYSLSFMSHHAGRISLSVVRGVNRAIRSHLATLSARLARA